MMKKSFVTKIAAVSLAAMMAVSFTACGGKKAEEPAAAASMINPVKEMTEEQMCEKTGIDLPLPEGATDVVYSVIESEDGDIAQVDFTLDGKEMNLRACHTKITTLFQDDPNADPRDFDPNEGDISGLCYNWNLVVETFVSNRDAKVHVSNDGPGYIAWLDVVPGIIYNLSMTDDADVDTLTNMAETVFVPMQGEA